MLAQDIYLGTGPGGGTATPGPLLPSKASYDHLPLTLPPILKGSLSNANIITGAAAGQLGGPYKEEFGMQPFGTKSVGGSGPP